MKRLLSALRCYRSFIGCCIICLIHTGINSVATAAMPYLKEYYGVELSTIIAGASACSCAMFLASFVGARFIRAAKPKGAFFVSTLCAALYAFLIYITDQVWGFYLGCALIGLTAAWGGHATSNIFVHRFHKNRAGTLIMALLSVGMLGGAGFQFLSGILLGRIGLRGLYLTMIGFAAVAALANLLLVENIEAEEDDVRQRPKAGKGNLQLYLSSAFLRLCAVTLCAASLAGTFGTLLVTFLMSHGISTELSTTCLSAYTLCGGCVAMVGGILADKFGYRLYVCYLYGTLLLGVACALIFHNFELFIVLPLMILFYAASSPNGSIYNMLAKPLFGKDALLAQTKLLSIGSLGSAVVLPIVTRIYETMGFNFLFGMQICIALVCFALIFPVLPKKMK